MSGFINPDGSGLVGGQKAGGQGQSFQLDSAGNLLVNVLGALSPGTPLPTADQLRGWLLNGQGFNATTGVVTAAAVGDYGLSVFNPAASGKNVLLYSMKAYNFTNSTQTFAYSTTADPALGSAPTVANLKAGGGSSVASVSYSAGNVLVPSSGTLDAGSMPVYTIYELLTNGAVILLPAGAADGVSLYLYVGTVNAKFSLGARWIEF